MPEHPGVGVGFDKTRQHRPALQINPNGVGSRRVQHFPRRPHLTDPTVPHHYRLVASAGFAHRVYRPAEEDGGWLC